MQSLCSLSCPVILAAIPAGTLDWRVFPAVGRVWVSSKVSAAVLERTSCKANVDSVVPVVLNQGSLRGSGPWWLYCGIAPCSSRSQLCVTSVVNIYHPSCKLHGCQSCSDITQFWVYFTVPFLQLGRTSTALNGIFFT